MSENLRTQIEQFGRLYVASSHVSRAVMRSRTRQELLDEVVRILVEVGRFSMSCVGWHHVPTAELRTVASFGDKSGYLQRIRMFTDDRPEGRGPGGTAFRTATPYICNFFPDDPRTLPWRENAMACGWRASAAFPILVHGEPAALLSVYTDDRDVFGDDQVELLNQVTLDIGFGLEHLESEQRRRQSDAELAASLSHLRLAMDAASLSIFEWDFDAHTFAWSGHFDWIFGSGPLEVDGREEGFYGRIHPEDLPRFLAAADTAMHEGGRFTQEFRTLWPGGESRWVLALGSVSEAGRRMLGAVMDISERKRAELEVRDARERAEAASVAKSAFLANMSHEIRTPLNGILCASTLLQDTPLSAEQAELTAIMRDSGELLLRLLTDILHLSQIESGRLKLGLAAFTFREKMLDAFRLIQPLAAKKGLRYTVRIDNAVPHTVFSDSLRLQQIVLNFLNNAVKFTETGFVALTVELARETESAAVVRIAVADSGPGIPADRASAVFEVFEQLDSSSTREKPGIGLGLSIARQLAKLLGGEVGVDSDGATGSTFWAEIPLPKANAVEAAPAMPAARADNAGDLRILLAEDNHINQLLTARLLRRIGCRRIDVAGDGREAVAKAAAEEYDLILMDVQMPGVDGVEAARAVRELPGPTRQARIVAVSASVVDSDRERCQRAGMDGFLAKPLEYRQLRELIEQCPTVGGARR